MSNKTFGIAGVSNLNGKVKFRFANGDLDRRQKVLSRGGHTRIKLVALPKSMPKDAAIAFLTRSKAISKVAKEIQAKRQKDPRLAKAATKALGRVRAVRKNTNKPAEQIAA